MTHDTVKISAVLLAAGASTRFDAGNKLLADINGVPLVVHALTPLLAAGLTEIVAVVASGDDGSAVADALADQPVRVAANPHAAEGMGTSIAFGIAALRDTDAGVLIALGDMPGLLQTEVSSLAASYRAHQGQRIVYPATHDGKQRNPVIWPAAYRSSLMALDGAEGARYLLAASSAHATPVVLHDERALSDIDTTEDLRRWRDQVARNMP